MRASKKLVEAIKKFEGCRLTAYKCPAGIWTIGFGSTRNVRKGMAITQAVAEARLINDITDVESQLAKLPLPKLTQGSWDAVVDFCFNLGVAKFKTSTLYKYICEQRPASEIQAQFKRWVYSGNVVLSGLKKRRDWEAQRWIEN